jgi:tRNA(Ile)-lysidine synthase
MIQTVREEHLSAAVASVPPGAWAVGVSGGADSVALLSLLRGRRDLSLHVVHLDHETRGEASAGDARFVESLAREWGLPVTVARWRDVEPLLGEVTRNRSARFRAGRLLLFRQVVEANHLRGVVLAHHADDVAETVLQRLLRGSGPRGLTGIRPRSTVGGLTILRPLLKVRRSALREWLREHRQAWREDESNTSRRYLRNRLRAFLATRPGLTSDLIGLAGACATVRQWGTKNAPPADERLAVDVLTDLPAPLAQETARQWLATRGAPPAELDAAVLARLIEMAADAASPTRQHFPGGVLVRRRGGELFVDKTRDPTTPRDGRNR